VDESGKLASQSIFGAFLEKDKDGKVSDFGPTSKKSIFSVVPSGGASSSFSTASPASVFANKGHASSTADKTPFTNFLQKDAPKILKQAAADTIESGSPVFGSETVSNGEDNESVVFNLRAKLYWRKTGGEETKWAEAGKGPLRLLKSGSSDSDDNKKEAASTRLVMRRELSENGAG
jgi:hypothetical protein